VTRYVVLLRAVGPVTHARMKLRALAEELGAVGNTGNLILASDDGADAVARRVSAAVEGFGLSLDVFIRTRRQLQMLVNLSPFLEAQSLYPEALGVCFFGKTPRWPEAYLAYPGPEQLTMFSNHLVVDYKGRATGSRLRIEKTVGARMTQRNWSTVLRLAAHLATNP
jgi:uncharacterized protein (DUF1697 family)